MRDVFIERLTEMAERDPRIMLITGDLGFGVLDDYAKRFPRRFIVFRARTNPPTPRRPRYHAGRLRWGLGGRSSSGR